jgi:hypothetical protein
MFDDITNPPAPDVASEPKTGPRKILFQVLGALAGWALAEYFRVGLLLIPGVALIAVYILARALRAEKAPFLHVVAFQTAHLVWFAAGAIATRQLAPVFADLVVLTALLVWILARPTRLPAICIGGFNALGAALTIYQLSSANDAMVKPLLLHLLLRLGIVSSVIFGVLKAARSRRTAEEPLAPRPA